VLVLAFDTATPAVTVAVADAGRVLAQETTVDARRQGELLAVSIEKVLAAAGVAGTDLDAIVSGAGPGPYTGLRVGLVTARVLGSALGVSACGICTLDVIAADAVPAAAGREFLVATDARRREVYWARYSPCRPRAREQLFTKVCSATRSHRAIRPPPLLLFFLQNGWRVVTRFPHRNRCTCADRTPGSPGHPRACCHPCQGAPPAPVWFRHDGTRRRARRHPP